MAARGKLCLTLKPDLVQSSSSALSTLAYESHRGEGREMMRKEKGGGVRMQLRGLEEGGSSLLCPLFPWEMGRIGSGSSWDSSRARKATGFTNRSFLALVPYPLPPSLFSTQAQPLPRPQAWLHPVFTPNPLHFLAG
ncbi:unnamed protein product [Chrysoparadoxa australica]